MTSPPSTQDSGPAGRQRPPPVPGWQSVELDGPVLRLPAGVRLDLGATAKGLGSDRAARAALAAAGPVGGVLVSLGGDIAVAGRAAAGRLAHPGRGRPRSGRIGAGPDGSAGRRRGRDLLDHLPRVDAGRSRRCTTSWIPGPGSPAAGPWRTVSAAAATCAEANAAATAAIVAGERRRRVARLGGRPCPAGQPRRAGAVRRRVARAGRRQRAGPVPAGPVSGSYGSGSGGPRSGAFGGPGDRQPGGAR